MAKIQCNVISYVLKRTVDLTVVLPTISIPEILQDKGSCITNIHSNIRFCIYFMAMGIIMHNGRDTLTWNCLQKKEKLQ